MGNYNGIESRQRKVRDWLKEIGFNGEYLLVSTKPNSIYSKKLAELKPSQKLIVDLYTPIFLEKELTLSKWKPQDWLTRFRNKEMVKKFLRRGNHFLVANRRQREYWIEVSRELGIPLGEKDISVFPTGAGFDLRSTIHDPRSGQPKVVLWFGGIYPWMDPESLVEAFDRIWREYPEWKLRILGGWQPGTGYKERYEQLINKARVIIPDSQLDIVGWQRNEDLSKYLKDVSFAVHLVKDTPEDYYAHRVRLLTLLSCGIPVVTSGKDVISDLMAKEKAGIKFINTPGVLENILRRALSSKGVIRQWQQNTSKIQEKFFQNEMDIRIKYNDKS